MKDIEAKNLVDATFTAAYNEDKFRLFISNLLNGHEEYEDPETTGKYIPEAFQDGVSSYKRLFKFIDPEGMEIDVLAVKLQNSKTLENARTMQRNFVARYLNGSREGALKDAALVAFYADDSDEWRFSLVRMDYVLDEAKNKIKKELTPARRFSFLVGGNEKTHTARRQLYPILTGHIETTLTELEHAFNIESVTKEFFEQYKELFLRLTESLDKVRKENQAIDSHLTLLHIETADLCKKLLGQIVFLYFLQKKGWLGVNKNEKWGTGDKNYLRSLLEHCIKEGDDKFFDHYLEPLFYDALAKERDRHYYPLFDCRIPFLNGGLFEPTNDYEWEHYDFNIPNELFSNNAKTKSGDKGDGILDIFDRYNFTVREDESLEKEVAVDPEMLGKVFENLLEVKDRKSKGAFYTPREIVHYMCQESLINYLDATLNIQKTPIDNKPQKTLLSELSETDLLTEYEEKYRPIVSKEDITDFIYHGDSFRENGATTKSKGKETNTDSFKIIENIRKHAKAIDKALADVKICDPAIGSGAFPVGIMHEIVRARLTLLESGLIKKTNKTNAYEYKRRAIQHSIYGVDIEESAIEIAKLRLWLSLVVDEVDMDEIKPLPNLTYKIVKGNSLLGIDKGDLFQHHHLKRLEELKTLYFDETSKSKKRKYEYEINKIIELFAKDGQFDFEIFFSEVFNKNDGFDIVIANVGEKGNKETFRKIKEGTLGQFYRSKMDLFFFFFHLSMQLGNNNSSIIFITTNYFLTADSAIKLRRSFLREVNISSLTNFGEIKVFDTAKGQHNIITSLVKYPITKSLIIDCSSDQITSSNELTKILYNNPKRQEISPKDLFEGENHYIRLSTSGQTEITNILDKISNNCKKLGNDNLFNINSGADVTISRITNRHLKFDKTFKVGKGVFVLNQKEINQINPNKNELSILKDFIKNSNIFSYGVNISSDKLIYTKWDDDIDKFPSIKRHLRPYKEILEDQARRYGEDYPWFALHRPRDQKIFEASQKIIVPYRAKKNIFGYTSNPVYSSRDVFYITPKSESLNIKYILALLNSKTFYLWYYHKGKRKGDTLELYATPLSETPIKVISENEQNKFIELVDLIINIKNSDDYHDNLNKQNKYKAIQSKIDWLIYQLYKFTPEEIKIIEDAYK